MPTWGELLLELQQMPPNPQGGPDLDGLRRKYLTQLHQLTGRDTILYYTDWMGAGGKQNVSIVLEDMQGMMEVCRGLVGPSLDLILHSPGGSPEATASIVRYLRTKFTKIRVFVPLAAMSAATMWALACDEIVMGKHSQLGPIDPQMVIPGSGQFPARGIIRQFERAQREIAGDSSLLGAWVPILQQYGPSLLDQCEQAELLARRLVEEWLSSYMFKRKKATAKTVADWFADYSTHQSHSVGITREQARSQGLKITNLEKSAALQDAVLSVHHAVMHTFQSTAAKIVENHNGKAWVQLQQVFQMQVPIVSPAPGGP